MPIYSLLADVVVILHAAYVAFVVFGLLAILAGWMCRAAWVTNFWFRITHLTMIAIVVVESWLGIVCPLTTLEKTLRRKAGQEAYGGDFVGRWVHDLLFFDFSPTTFVVIYTVFGLLVVGTLFLAPPRWPGRRSAAMSADEFQV